MNSFEINIILDEVTPIISRKVNIPSGITFNCLHEIIQTVFSFENNHPYKFIFSEINLEIKETNTFNQNTVYPNRELIDKYFDAFKIVEYEYDFWKIILEIKILSQKTEYPQLISYKGLYNPSENIKSVDKFNKLLENKSKERLKTFSRLKTQKNFMRLFNIPYEKVEKHIVKSNVNPKNTLNKYFK